jgi:hypothetical protein
VLYKAAKDEDASSVIEEVSETSRGGLDGLDFGVYPLREAIRDGMKNEGELVGQMGLDGGGDLAHGGRPD